MESPILSVFKNFFICSADVAIRLNRVHFLFKTCTPKKYFVHHIAGRRSIATRRQVAEKYLAIREKSSLNYGFQLRVDQSRLVFFNFEM